MRSLGRHDTSHNRQYECFFNGLFFITDPLWGNSTVTGGISSQKASNMHKALPCRDVTIGKVCCWFTKQLSRLIFAYPIRWRWRLPWGSSGWGLLLCSQCHLCSRLSKDNTQSDTGTYSMEHIQESIVFDAAHSNDIPMSRTHFFIRNISLRQRFH